MMCTKMLKKNLDQYHTHTVRDPLIDLEYADDTLILGRSTKLINTMLHSIETHSETFGMQLNLDKTILVTMNKPDSEQATISFKDGTPVKRTNTATYLGILCNENATQLPNLNARLGKASNTFNKLQLFWKHSNIPQKMKLRFFKQIFNPMILYGLEYSCVTPTMERKLNAWQAGHLRRILDIKVSMISHITNADILLQANTVPLSNTLFSNQLKYMGHVLRTEHTESEHSCCFTSAGNLAQLSACKRVGRPKHHWAPNTLHKIIENKNTLFATHPHACPSSTVLLRPFKELAQDKSLWKVITAAPTRLPKANLLLGSPGTM